MSVVLNVDCEVYFNDLQVEISRKQLDTEVCGSEETASIKNSPCRCPLCLFAFSSLVLVHYISTEAEIKVSVSLNSVSLPACVPTF